MAEKALPKEEFQDRYGRLRERMAQARLDAVLACSPGNQFWLTGCVGLIVSSHETTFGYDTLYPKIVLPAEGEPTLIGLRICAEAYAMETHITDIRTFIPPVWERRSALMHEVLRGIDRRHGRVGIDTGEYSTITPSEFKMLKEQLPEVEFVEASPIFQELRAIKSPREQQLLREAARVQLQAFDTLRQRIHAGMSETEILAELTRCQVEAGSSETSVSIAWSNPGYAFFRAPWSDRRLKRGDFLWIDGGAVVHGYCSDIDEVFVVGKPTAEHLELFANLERDYREGLKFWKTGRTAREISQDTLDMLRRHGTKNALDPEIFVGHNIGYEIVEAPVFASWSAPEVRLREGMVLCPEWYNETPYGAMLYEETYLVDKEGLEPLVPFHAQLGEIPE